ncbi:hypothetical protein CMV_022246 [Castanea mollissima]|uniref:WAT1-related protein n=1 Tax=Castanea mollissima TaxID=60419 RepID=A0A8J4QMK9_9ROSI|nr:hypothetical protein CMV_022246 [Castanea mollissima]
MSKDLNLKKSLRYCSPHGHAYLFLPSLRRTSKDTRHCLISKAAFNEGMSPLVLNAYGQAIATIVLVPFAFLLERMTHCSLSLGLFCKIFLAALCGPAASLDFYYMALRYTSATYGTAMLNTIPVVASIFSVLLRMETVGWSSFYGILKIVGMFITVGGAILLSFYWGPPLKIPHAPCPGGSSTETSHVGGHKNLIVGPVLMFLCSVAWSLWLIMQPKLLTQYPAKLKLSALQCLLSSVQSTVIAAALQGNFNSWKIGWDIQLASLAYCVILVAGFTYGLQVWCIEKKGPFYVAIFSPLSLLITTIFSALVWSEQLSCGSLLGGIMVVGGLYSVLWGRSKEYYQLMLKSEPPSEKGQDIERD